jgi:hypothetical protein
MIDSVDAVKNDGLGFTKKRRQSCVSQDFKTIDVLQLPVNVVMLLSLPNTAAMSP